MGPELVGYYYSVGIWKPGPWNSDIVLHDRWLFEGQGYYFLEDADNHFYHEQGRLSGSIEVSEAIAAKLYHYLALLVGLTKYACARRLYNSHPCA